MDARTAGWRGRCLGPTANRAAGPPLRPSASQPTGPSLDRLDVIRGVQADLSAVQAPLAPALLIFVLYLGQLIPCKTKGAVLVSPLGPLRVSNVGGRCMHSPGVMRARLFLY